MSLPNVRLRAICWPSSPTPVASPPRRCRRLARETNLAETTFILPPDDAARDAGAVRVRIFTTQEELPFAGHPTLGTASWLYWNHPTLAGAEAITLDLQGGPVTVRFRPPTANEAGVFGTMQQRDPVFGAIHAPHEIAHATGLALEDLDPSLPVQTVSTGLPFCIVPLRSVQALDRLAIPQALAQAYLADKQAKFFYLIAPAPPGSDASFHTRMQFYNGEDPATGSAAGCAIAYLVHHGVVASNAETILKQGLQIHRPAKIFVRAALTADGVSGVFVGGRTIAVATGRFSLP